MNRPTLISVLGNSVPILMQPFRQGPADMTYSEHLREQGFAVLSGAKQSTILADVYHYLEDECIRHFPDFVIINFGIVECTYRARPRWLQNIFSMNAWNNSVIRKGYNGPITRGLKFIGKKIYRQTIERPSFRLGVKHRWLKPSTFRFILRDIIKRIFQDTPVRKIIIIGMPPVASWVEHESPGTSDSVNEYNRMMAEVAKENPNLHFIDPQSINNDPGQALFSPDGIHFTAAGHQRLSEVIIPLLTGERQDYDGWQSINQYQGLYRIYENWHKRKTPRSE